MKTITEFINETMENGKAKGYLWSYGDWRDYLDDDMSWEEFCEGDGEDLKPAERKKMQKTLDEVKKYMISCGHVFLGNWDPDYSDEDWDYFYNESGCKNKNLCLVFFQDGDDGDFYYVQFKKNVPDKLVEEFKALFNDDVWFSVNA